MSKPIIHILTIAGSDLEVAKQLGLNSGRELLEFTRKIIGSTYRVTADSTLLEATVDERYGGRRDDRRRVRSLQAALANERVVALVALRGGAWLTRILGEVDFDVLNQRTTRLFLFGFSELSTLINIVASYRKARAYCDIAPGYLPNALTERDLYCRNRLSADHSAARGGSAHTSVQSGAPDRFRSKFGEHLLDVIDIIEGRGSGRVLAGRMVAGTVRDGVELRIIGGCLSVLVALLGTPYQKCIRPRGRWLALEDIREPAYRLDRYFAQLKLAGMFEQCAGLLLGDFHAQDQEQTGLVLELLKHHLPGHRRLPIIGNCNFGHCYPCAPLPLNQPLRVKLGPDRRNVRLSPLV